MPDATPAEPEHGIGTRTLRGMAWAYGAYGGGRVLVLVSTAILARLLTPRDFGVVALALIFTSFLEAIKDLGLSEALIVSDPKEEAARAQTVFSWTVLLACALTLLIAGLAPLMAKFFHQPQLVGLVPVLGLSFPLRALGATHYALARKHLDYRVRTISEICEVAVRGVAGIALALAGAGPWSLVLGYILGTAVSTTVLWLRVSFAPRLRLTRAHLRDLVRFGGVLTIVDLSAVAYYNIDYLFVGRLLGAASLGLYSIGFRIPELAILNVAHVAADVLFPAYSAVDRARLREAYVASLRYLTMLTVPIAVAIVVLARPIVLVVFGHQWTGSIAVSRVVAVYALFATLAIPPGTVLKVTRRAWRMVAFAVPAVLILIGLLVIFTRHGILTVAVVTTALQATAAPVQALVVSRQLRMSFLVSLRPLVAPALATAAMAAALFVIDRAIAVPWAVLAVGIPVGVLVYLGALVVLAREHLLVLRRMAFPGARVGV
ncbi:MAG TPA: lipopolysaccharide biosynthesis protein [Solirubrobacteraceae bacterium]|jgi:PST family polysaccharide transporter|nr:lipopolysaccharide biosynthesis protein [Solirubrobacteraceae bacterium]